MEGNISKAIESVNKAISIKPNPILERDVKLLQLLLEDKGEKYEEALKVLESVKESMPEIKNDQNILKSSNSLIYCNADIMSTYNYPIFGFCDIIAYRSVFQFYLKNYQEALSLLSQLEKHTMSEVGCFSLNANSNIASSMTLDECQFNILLCLIAINKHMDALKLSNHLLITLKPHFTFPINLIRYVIQKSLGKDPKGILYNVIIVTSELNGFDVEKFSRTKCAHIAFKDDSFTSSFPFVKFHLNDYSIVKYIIKY